MSKYTLVPGDIVDFTDPTSGKIYRGFIDQYKAGRAHNRDYSVKFDTPWHGFDGAWCSADDLELVRPTKHSSTVTFASSQVSNPISGYDNQNIKINQKLNTQTSTSTVGSAGGNGSFTTESQPWTAYYMTVDDFFDILKVAFEDTYGGNDHRWHPEDLYVNISCVLEIVSNTLANSARLKSNKPLYGVKEGLV